MVIVRGIYQIKNKYNGKVYIGSSNNIIKRWKEHIDMLYNGIHHSYLLQDDFKVHKLNGFDFSILCTSNINDNLLTLEQEYLDNNDQKNLYNVMLNVNYKSISMPDDLSELMCITKNTEKEVINKLKHNINIFEKNYSYLKIGEGEYDLSKSWFVKTEQSNINKLKNANRNYLQNSLRVKQSEFYWTTFSQQFNKLCKKGMFKSFIPINGNLIDDADRRNNLVFAANCFPNSFVKNAVNEKINDDLYALSIMVRWLLAVSDIDSTINIYLPSLRMEKILTRWKESIYL